MTEITEEAYQSLREFAFSAHPIPNQWDYIALYDTNKDEVIRVSITNDDRFTWDDLDGDAVGQIIGSIRGSDSDIPTDGTTISYAAVHDSASGGRRITELEQIPDTKFNGNGVGLDLTHNIEIPVV